MFFLVINVYLDYILVYVCLVGMIVILEELYDKIVQYLILLMGDFNVELGEEVY